MKKQDYALDSETSKRLGIQITKYRKKLREEALVRHKQDALWQEVAIDDITGAWSENEPWLLQGLDPVEECVLPGLRLRHCSWLEKER